MRNSTLVLVATLVVGVGVMARAAAAQPAAGGTSTLDAKAAALVAKALVAPAPSHPRPPNGAPADNYCMPALMSDPSVDPKMLMKLPTMDRINYLSHVSPTPICSSPRLTNVDQR
jgi:hypothetical protein